MGRLAQLSQQHAEAWLGNQVPETAALAALARECGAMAATSFGAGFGGSVWALVDADESDRFAREWLSAYARRFADQRNVAWFAARPGPPVTEIHAPQG